MATKGLDPRSFWEDEMETDEESNMRIFARRYMVFSAYFMSYSIIIAGSIIILIFILYFPLTE
jgi:hypothetical protein